MQHLTLKNLALLVVALLAVPLIVFLILGRAIPIADSEQSSAESQTSPVATTGDKSASVSQYDVQKSTLTQSGTAKAASATAPSSSSVRMTYLPGQKREAVPVDAKTLPINARWLYATSEEEALWLDRYGYPTPTDEAWLMSADELALQQAVDAGDKNAAIHLSLRALTRNVKSGDLANARKAIDQVFKDAIAIGPYGHTKTVFGIGEILQWYKKIPEADKKTELTEFIGALAGAHQGELAIAGLYGDLNFNGHLRLYPSDIKPLEKVEADYITSHVAAVASRQKSQGKPAEAVFTTRPYENDPTKPNMWFVRK
jgi:hypothetical protein